MERQDIKALLPHGSMQQIATRAGVSMATVTQWFTGRHNSERVQTAVLEVLAEVQAKRQGIQAKFEAALRGEKI
jgi:AcrR family transcriptional regulator